MAVDAKARSGCFVAWLLLLPGLAGCMGDGVGGAGGPANATDAVGPGDVGSPGAGAEVEAVVVVWLDGNATQPIDGAIDAVAGTNLTFDGSRSLGANLTYAWDLGDGATAGNATVVHAYAEAGRYEATLEVSHGNASSRASVVLNVSSAGPVPGTLLWTDERTFSGTLAVGNPNAANLPDMDHRDHVIAIGEATPDGVPAAAHRAVIVLDGSGAAAVILHLLWRSPSGANLASATANAPDQRIEYEAPMPPGDYVVRVRFFAGAQASYTVAAQIDYVAV